MPNLPTLRDVHVDTLLSDFGIAYGQDLEKDYLTDRGTTVVSVKKQSNKYRIYDKGDFFRSEMGKREPGTPSRGGGFRVSNSNYEAEQYSLHTLAAEAELENDDMSDLDRKKVRYLAMQAKLKRDKLTAATAFVTGVWTSNTEQTGKSSSPSTNEFLQWNDESSTPISDVQTKADVIETSIGQAPNVAWTNKKVLRALRRHPDLLDLTKYTSAGLVPMSALLEALELDAIFVGNANENTAKEGQTASMSRVFGNHFLLARIAPSPSTDEATAVTTFVWSKFDKVTVNDVAVKKWWVEDLESWKYEASMYVDVKITANDAGLFFKDAVA